MKQYKLGQEFPEKMVIDLTNYIDLAMDSLGQDEDDVPPLEILDVPLDDIPMINKSQLAAAFNKIINHPKDKLIAVFHSDKAIPDKLKFQGDGRHRTHPDKKEHIRFTLTAYNIKSFLTFYVVENNRRIPLCRIHARSIKDYENQCYTITAKNVSDPISSWKTFEVTDFRTRYQTEVVAGKTVVINGVDAKDPPMSAESRKDRAKFRGDIDKQMENIFFSEDRLKKKVCLSLDDIYEKCRFGGDNYSINSFKEDIRQFNNNYEDEPLKGSLKRPRAPTFD